MAALNAAPANVTFVRRVSAAAQSPAGSNLQQGMGMSHDILTRLGLDHLDASSPDFLKTLQRLQREAWENMQRDERAAGTAQNADEAGAD